MIRWIGFVLIVSGSASAGIMLAASLKHSLELYRQSLTALAYMKGEIEFHLMPLNEITYNLGRTLQKPLAGVFRDLSRGIANCPGIPLGAQMKRILQKSSLTMPMELKGIWISLFDLMGKQDVLAQVRAIHLAEEQINREIARLSADRHERARAYRIIGVCTGLALAVILI